ncbi:MAG: hypothetical protein ACYS26_20990 [Planctomycetota bacterium]|jgi:hypothetical protein
MSALEDPETSATAGPAPFSAVPWLEALMSAFGSALIVGSVLGEHQLYEAFKSPGRRLDGEALEPLADVVLRLAEFALPVVRRVTGDSNTIGLAHSILFVHWGLVVMGGALLIVPTLLLRRRNPKPPYRGPRTADR